jgi:sulfite reductase (ferredoxin)
MNFVKTKLELSRMEAGRVLEVLLDDGEPVENVPRSARAEGHEVVEQERRGRYWSVRIRKA